MTDETGPPSRSAKPTLRGLAARTAGATFVGYGLTQIMTLGTYSVLARLTTPHVFGVFGAGTILLSMGELFMESGMSAALVQRRRDVEEAASTAFVATLVAGVLLALGALAGSVVVGLYFHSHKIGVVAAALSGTIAINAASIVPMALLQRRLSPLRFVVVEPAAAVAFGVASGLGLAYGLGVWGLIVGSYAWSVTRSAAMWASARWRPRIRSASWAVWRELAGYGRHVVASELLREVTRVATTALVGRFLGATSLGEFRFAWRLANQASGPVLHANAQVLFPAVAEAKGEEDVKRRSIVSVRLVTLVSFPLSAFFLALGQPVALILFGQKWSGVGPVLVALAALPAGEALESIAAEVFKARARPDILPRMHAIKTLASVGLVALLLPSGAVGVGLGFSITAVIVFIYAFRRLAPIIHATARELGAELAPSLASALVAGAAAFVIDRLLSGVLAPNVGLAGVRILVGCLIGGAIYLVMIAALSRRVLPEARRTFAAFRGSAAAIDPTSNAWSAADDVRPERPG